MEPIISPKVFYLIKVVNNLSVISIVLMLFLLVAVIICTAFLICAIKDDMIYDECEKESSVYKKILKKLIIPFVIFSLLTIFLPNESTMYKMLIADNITSHNIEVIGNEAKDVVDYIVESVDKLMEEEENE